MHRFPLATAEAYNPEDAHHKKLMREVKVGRSHRCSLGVWQLLLLCGMSTAHPNLRTFGILHKAPENTALSCIPGSGRPTESSASGRSARWIASCLYRRTLCTGSARS